ncbi:phage shock protein C (PspC) family protein [Sphingomonas gellani]|uniref:Phage shock protein C (PspC) family protein n=1 Tax=Sphingomonas gellani TaxID=1166340 RepID=A0A1H8AJD9_9SPHN|nr:PspC domain-containing protein [Sphingomonas gellani]SEM70084.1 phage shock protein C (PspC) family protein [Sphingomonas gellani]
MQTPAANPFMRADTLFGTCQAIGEDFGINPLFLRLAFAVGVFWSAGWAFAVYAGLSFVVLASHLLFPMRARRATPLVEQAPVVVQAENDQGEQPTALAA